MKPNLQIAHVHLSPTFGPGRMADMARRCAFAICTQGEFTVRIFNEYYTVRQRSLLACMPFVNIQVINVAEPSDIIIGYILTEDVPAMINHWVNSKNLATIQNNPLLQIKPDNYTRIITAIREYQTEYADSITTGSEMMANRIQHDIVDYQSRLIVAQVLKSYFTATNMEVSGQTHSDIIFQHFMLSLYGNFREHRDVQFYAQRSGVSIKYFSTIVRKLSGTSPSEWIETVVIAEAKSMLGTPERSIKDIALSLNFPDAPTFTKYFRRLTGMTPKAFRKTVL